MANVNLAGLDEIYAAPVKEASSAPKGGGLNLSGLDDIYHSPTESDQPSTAHDFGKGVVQGGTLNTDTELGGGLQALLDKMQSGAHNLGLTGPSVTQTAQALQQAGTKGDIGPTSDMALYRQAQLENKQSNDQAAARSPVANFAGQLAGSALPMALLGASPVALGAQGAVSGVGSGDANVLGPDSNLGGVAKNAMIGGALGYTGGKLGEAVSPLIGKAVGAVADSAPVQALKAGLKGIDLTSKEAAEKAGQDLLQASDEASQHIDQMRKEVGAQRDAIEKNPQGNTVDLSEPMDKIQDSLDNLKGGKRIEQGKEELMSLLRPEAQYTEIVPGMQDIPETPSAFKKLDSLGQQMVEKENLLGNNATYHIVEGAGDDGQNVLHLVIRKDGAEAGQDTASIARSVPNAPGQEGQQLPIFSKGEQVSNNTPISPKMTPQQAIDLRNQLRNIASDDSLHPQVRQVAQQAFNDIQSAVKNQIQGLAKNDELYSALKKAQDVFGKEYNHQDQLQQSGQTAQLFNKSENGGIGGALAKAKLNQALGDVAKVNPQAAQQINQNIGQKLDQFNLAQQASNPSISTDIGKSIKNSGAFAGNLAGRGIEALTPNVIKPALGSTADLVNRAAGVVAPKAIPAIATTPSVQSQFSKKVPDFLRKNDDSTNKSLDNRGARLDNNIEKNLYAASPERLAQVGSSLEANESTKFLGQALNNAVKNNNTMGKNAAIFAIMQNPNSRQLLGNPEAEKKSNA